LKTFVEEQEMQSAAPAVAQPAKSPREVRVIHIEATPQTQAQAKVDVYPSCLELAAEFIARG